MVRYRVMYHVVLLVTTCVVVGAVVLPRSINADCNHKRCESISAADTEGRPAACMLCECGCTPCSPGVSGSKYPLTMKACRPRMTFNCWDTDNQVPCAVRKGYFLPNCEGTTEACAIEVMDDDCSYTACIYA